MLKKAMISIVVIFNLFWGSNASSTNTKHVKPAVIKKHHIMPVVKKTRFSAAMLAAWQKVAICEEGGNWKYFTYWYPNALGITRPNWIQFGGSVVKASDRFTQIEVAERFRKYYGIDIPDQNGCHPW